MPDVTITTQEAREILQMLSPASTIESGTLAKLRKAAEPRKITGAGYMHAAAFVLHDFGYGLTDAPSPDRVRVRVTIEEVSE